MKKTLILLVVTAALSVTASANNGDQGGELLRVKTEKPSCSLNVKFMSLCTLFCVEAAKPDSIKSTVKREAELVPAKED